MIFIPEVNLDQYSITEDIMQYLSEDLIKKYRIVPVLKLLDRITIATRKPTDITMFKAVERFLQPKFTLDIIYADEISIENVINYYFRSSNDLDEALSYMPEEKESTDSSTSVVAHPVDPQEAPIVNLVRLIIQQAVVSGASDIHVCPMKHESLVRIRIDGELQEIKRYSIRLHQAVVSRVKIMGHMDIAESRIPQDGQAKVDVMSKAYELRVSTLPTANGENIVIRILDPSRVQYALDSIGLSSYDYNIIKKMINLPYGMMLVTGPTGSGKTSTLFTMLNTINDVSTNIITLEDPVEFEIPLVRQVQVNVRAGLTFAAGLRSILRQDPDVIMVGEIRDLETAELAVRSALTGHLVLSTLHTNDAPSSISRLIDMGIEPFLVAASVTCIVAQRLVRKICSNCKVPYKCPPDLLHDLNLPSDQTVYIGKGCKKCLDTGYSGRIAIFEIMPITEEIREKVTHQATTREIRDLALEQGMVTLRQAAIQKLKDGLTSPQEAISKTSFI